MSTDVDWSHGEEHMFTRHRITVVMANEALTDPDRIVISPGHNSRSGRSDEVIGYSHTLGDVVMVVLVTGEDGVVYGANGWRAEGRWRRMYHEQGR